MQEKEEEEEEEVGGGGGGGEGQELPKSTFSTLEADLDESLVVPQPQLRSRQLRPPSAPPLFAYPDPTLSLSFPAARPRSPSPSPSTSSSSNPYPSRLATSSARYPPLFSPGTGLRPAEVPQQHQRPKPAYFKEDVALSPPETSSIGGNHDDDDDDATSMSLPSIWSRIARPSQPQPRPRKSESESESEDSATAFEEASTTRLPPSWSDLERIVSKSKKHDGSTT